MAKEHHDFNDVIADSVAGAFMVLQILIGGFPDASGFFLRNGIAGSAIKVSSAALDFNKDKQMALAGHKIKFPMTGTVVLGLIDAGDRPRLPAPPSGRNESVRASRYLSFRSLSSLMAGGKASRLASPLMGS